MISHRRRVVVPLGLATVGFEVLPVTVRSWPRLCKNGRWCAKNQTFPGAAAASQ